MGFQCALRHCWGQGGIWEGAEGAARERWAAVLGWGSLNHPRQRALCSLPEASYQTPRKDLGASAGLCLHGDLRRHRFQATLVSNPTSYLTLGKGLNLSVSTSINQGSSAISQNC